MACCNILNVNDFPSFKAAFSLRIFLRSILTNVLPKNALSFTQQRYHVCFTWVWLKIGYPKIRSWIIPSFLSNLAFKGGLPHVYRDFHENIQWLVDTCDDISMSHIALVPTIGNVDLKEKSLQKFCPGVGSMSCWKKITMLSFPST